MRAMLGILVLELPSAYATDADDYLAKGLATRDALKEEPLLGFAFAPHAPYTIADATFGRINTLAEQLGLPLHTHIHETADEIQASLKQYGVRPLERLARLGLLGPNFIGVHAVHVSDAEIDLLAQNGCHVAHCPTSNLKLASGIAPVAKFAAAGINLGLGTKVSASNNRLEPVRRDAPGRPGWPRAPAMTPAALPAAAALKMATLDAAPRAQPRTTASAASPPANAPTLSRSTCMPCPASRYLTRSRTWLRCRNARTSPTSGSTAS